MDIRELHKHENQRGTLYEITRKIQDALKVSTDLDADKRLSELRSCRAIQRTTSERSKLVEIYSSWFYDHTESFRGDLGVHLAYLWPAIIKGTSIEVSAASEIVVILRSEAVQTDFAIWDYLDIKKAPIEAEEAVIVSRNGYEVRTPAYPLLCDYIRVVTEAGTEIIYWDRDEWTSDETHAPQIETFGAIMSVVKRVHEGTFTGDYEPPKDSGEDR